MIRVFKRLFMASMCNSVTCSGRPRWRATPRAAEAFNTHDERRGQRTRVSFATFAPNMFAIAALRVDFFQVTPVQPEVKSANAASAFL